MKINLLAFAAHPDDAELTVSGILHSHKLKGYTTGIIDLTKGELGTRGTIETRAEEAAFASAILHLDVRENLGFEDGYFTNDKDHQLAVINALRKYQPDIILINAPFDRHPDHGKASQLLIDASFLSGLAKIETFDKLTNEAQKSWRPKKIFHYIQDFYIEPTLIIDISESFTVKMQAVKAFKTQFYSADSTEPETYISRTNFLDEIEGRAKGFGKRIGTKYGEGLIKANTNSLGFSNLFHQILPEFT